MVGKIRQGSCPYELISLGRETKNHNKMVKQITETLATPSTMMESAQHHEILEWGQGGDLV